VKAETRTFCTQAMEIDYHCDGDFSQAQQVTVPGDAWNHPAAELRCPVPPARTTARIDGPLKTAVFMNIYWDSSWDANNPSLRRATIDSSLRAVIENGYFSGLSEYGGTSVSFAGSLLPNKHCTQRAPNRVGFYDPVNASIAGFIQCEHDNESSLRAAHVVYNVILPQSSVESDAWSDNFCSGPETPSAWHYHGLEKISLIPPNLPFGGDPEYAIVMTNPKCFREGGDVLVSILHEMVELLTDPSPVDISIIPPHWRTDLSTEVADVCEEGKPNSGPLPVSVTDAAGRFLVPFDVATYWSNSRQQCVPSSLTVPACAAGTTRCDSGCADTKTDRNNCGACGVTCNSSSRCSAFKCVASNPCRPNQHLGTICWKQGDPMPAPMPRCHTGCVANQGVVPFMH
jgi:hypothetical protein